MTDYISLHNQTDYSILDSLISPKELLLKAKELNQSAIAITDHGTLAAVWDGLKYSKETGVKLIVGCEMYFRNVALSQDERMRHITLIAKNQIGYKNLLTINKLGYDNNIFPCKRVYSVIDWKILEKYKEGLICLTGCGNGIVSQLLMNSKFDEAEETLLKLKNLFKEDLGIEVHPNNMKRNANNMTDEIDQQFLNRRLIDMAKKHDIKVIPTNNAHYLKKEDHETHDVLLAIGSRQPVYSNFRLKYNTPEFYMKSGEEVKAFFSRNYGEEFAEQICANTIEFANKCEIPDWIDPKFSNPSGKELPIFPVKDELDYVEFKEWSAKQPKNIQEIDEDKQYLRFLCEKKFDSVLKINPDQIQIYKDRIAEEIEVFEFHGFSSYMLIVADYIRWAKNNNVSVGTGRGSVGGSLVSHIIGIHEADPIKYNLIFARFHNKEKSSFPDVDCDFATSGRAQVQQYLKNKYGEDHVAHVSNVNTITPKIYIKDVARSCEFGGSKDEATKIGNMIADIVPADIKSIDEAISKIPLFNEHCKKYPELIKHKLLSGKPRATSTHAGGIVLSARSLVGLVPVRRDKEGNFALEYDKDKAEQNGLIKMDILGLSTLDIISNAESLIKESNDIENIPYDESFSDKKTYDLLSSGKTFCVFQLGISGGTIDLCKRINPKTVNDISHINALARPSARDIRNDFIATKNGKKKFTLLDSKLARAFNDTFGFGLYEESLMYLAQDVAGWSLHSADRLRKLTKEKGKNPKKAAQWRQEFIDDSVKNDVKKEIAEKIWDEVVEPFGGYGFNQSLESFQGVDIYTFEGSFIKSKFIKDVLPGDFVKSRDECTKKEIFIEVINNHNHNIQPVYEIELESGEKVKCTMDHKFRTLENGEMLPLWQIIRDKFSIVVNTALS